MITIIAVLIHHVCNLYLILKYLHFIIHILSLFKGSTMYHASNLINNDHYEIYIIDGQNKSQIKQYIQANNTNNWDPCIPKPFNTNSTSITITFDSNNINDLNDWYPMEICYNNSNKYKNEYLFDGAKSLIINNLIVNNFVISSTYNNYYTLIRSIDYFDASIQCRNCKFVNISGTVSKPLLGTMGSVHLFDCQFFNVSVSTNILYGQHVLDYSDHAVRKFVLKNTSFSAIKAYSILTTTPSRNDVKFKIVSSTPTFERSHLFLFFEIQSIKSAHHCQSQSAVFKASSPTYQSL